MPANEAARKAVESITGNVRVDIRQTRGNVRRNSLYWAILAVAAPILSERIEGDPLDENMLHRILKDRKGLYREVALPSGEIWKDYESTSFAKMTEDERAAFIDWSLQTLGKWIGVDPVTLLDEARNV